MTLWSSARLVGMAAMHLTLLLGFSTRMVTVDIVHVLSPTANVNVMKKMVINLVFFFSLWYICTLRSICNCVPIIVCVCNHRILKKVIEGSAYRSFERGRRGVLPSSLISTLHPKSIFFKSFALFSLRLISLIVV